MEVSGCISPRPGAAGHGLHIYCRGGGEGLEACVMLRCSSPGPGLILACEAQREKQPASQHTSDAAMEPGTLSPSVLISVLGTGMTDGTVPGKMTAGSPRIVAPVAEQTLGSAHTHGVASRDKEGGRRGTGGYTFPSHHH